ncbi:hypothetical protein ACIPY0_20345 [Paenarthrobacter nicotinovorans]|uniref:hypothetical protein n=1 Tax=Paenarthrobacter nicotinovorans TaxID=29320 RepID=UPI00380D43D6
MNIPKEAIEAAAKAWDAIMGDRYGDEAVEELSDEVTAILVNALPIIAQHMRDERQGWCLDDAGRYWIKRTLHEMEELATGPKPFYPRES